jgi:hypothetical protein
MEKWKDINDDEDRVSKTGLVPLFMMSWEAPMFDVMLEFLNTSMIKGTNI